MTSFLLAGTTFGSMLDSTFSGFDYSIFQFFGGLQNDVLTFFAQIFTAMGSTLFVALFALMGVVMIFFKRTRKVGFSIVIAVIIGTVLTNVLIKPWALRVRPYNSLQADLNLWNWYVNAGMLCESDYCFPSGHTTGATEIALALLLCHATSKRKSARYVCWIFPLAAIAVGASRVYLMVHYATDVLGGFIIGTISGVAGFLLAKLICKKQEKDPAAQKMLAAPLRAGGVAAIILGFLVIFAIGFTYTRSNSGDNAARCEYQGDYDCQNEIADSNKYPPINGHSYCKIHWKQLTGTK